MTTERIAVSMSKNDFAYLNYIRQGALYSGKSVSLLPEIGDILKAIIFHSIGAISGDWESGGRDILVKFYSVNNDENALKNLPKTKDDFLSSIVKNEDRTRIKRIGKFPKERPSIFYGGEDYEKFRHETGKIPDNGLTNYILTIKEHEKDMIFFLKKEFFRFSDRTFSNSEIIRFLLRYYFIYPEDSDKNLKIEQFLILSSFYIYGLYGYSPIESMLLSHGRTSFLGIETDKEKLDMLKKIYYDKTLFDIYIEEIKNIMDEKNNKKENTLFDDINENEKLNQKYKSMASGFSFHSSFIGYTLLFMEWSFSQHNLPILMTYLYAKNNEASIGDIYFRLALNSFEDWFREIFDLSKNYDENEESLF